MKPKSANTLGRRVVVVSTVTLVALVAQRQRASAAEYNYVDWTEADVAGGTASGVITLPDDSTVMVTFEAINEDGTPGNLYGAQVSGGANYWSPSTPYISEQVENPPPDTDLLQLSGGQNQTYRVTLSEPIKDPIMAIVSLGAGGVPTTYDFDSPFTIVSQGAGYWGGSDSALELQPDDVLLGKEGHGTIQFIGTFSTFSWTVPTPESWHGFTFGIRTTERLEPSPDLGVDAGVDAGPAGLDASVDAALDTVADLSAPADLSNTPLDASSNPDSATTVEEEDGGGCSCRTNERGHLRWGWLLLLGLAFGRIVWRRRRVTRLP